jgi:hypothetical protein
MRRAVHRRKLWISRQLLSRARSGSPEACWFEYDRAASDRAEQPVSARRIQRAILQSLPRDDALRLEYIRRRWQRGQL